MSRLPFEQMMARCRRGSGAFSAFSGGARGVVITGASGVSSATVMVVSPVGSRVRESGSDAALRFGQPGDPGGELARALGEELVELLHVDPGELGDPAQARRLPGLRGVLAAEGEHLPVPG